MAWLESGLAEDENIDGRDEVGCWRAMLFQKEEEHEPVHGGRKSLGGECAGEILRVQIGWQI